MKPTLLDRAIAAVSPRAGMERLAARAQMVATATVLGGGSGGYRGAQPDRTARRGWFVRPRSANADILPGLERMRGAQRDAAMNQPIATAAINRKTIFTIGTGLMAIPALDGAALGLSPEEQETWEQRIAADFDAYMTRKNVTDRQETQEWRKTQTAGVENNLGRFVPGRHRHPRRSAKIRPFTLRAGNAVTQGM